MSNDDDPAGFAAAVNIVAIGAARSRKRPIPLPGSRPALNNRTTYPVTIDTENPRTPVTL